MAKYETMLITSAALDEEASSALIGKFKSLIEANGTIDSIDEWGLSEQTRRTVRATPRWLCTLGLIFLRPLSPKGGATKWQSTKPC